ncbi:immunoglobulin lambda-1 light chain-like [Stegostoma tigrinum]|uniref:immunoglobulin lambda-1 light chain-like n=1 Tax=Stegostoma tigrinum TaxID=3053191 RepID=UPI0028709E8C|nr:immunoglobulin lambda-1 light chain-like [Stegostoma tigrinum]
MSLYCWLIAVTALPCGYFAQTLKQIVPSITKTVGKTARFKCEVEGATITATDPLHWYQHKPGQAPTRILYYGSGATRDPGFGERFKAGKSNNKVFYLTIDKLEPEDTATYYCAYWIQAGARLQFGTGTRLVVTDQSVREPKIQIFPPNQSELDKNNRAAVVCLLTDFFPEVIRVQWTIGNNKASDDAVLTDAVEKQKNGAYSVISRLTITKFDWTGKDIHCKAEHETNPKEVTINQHSRTANEKPNDIPVPTCQPSVQNTSTIVIEGQPLSSLKLATFTYTLLLVKSVVYCGIISILYRLEHRDVKKPL